jgi:DNA-binding FadR family transcriptional regulator
VSPRTTRPSTRRSAETIARAIELEIIAEDLVPGTRIASEAELMSKYAASRGVIREAVTLVESHMLAQNRRGVGGGLIVVEPDSSVIVDLVSVFLARQKASEVELHEVRIALEVFAVQKIIADLDEAAIELLKREMHYELQPEDDIAAASQRFHLALAELSDNKVLQLFVPITTLLVEEMWSQPHPHLSAEEREETWCRVSACHAKIIEAMLDRRTDLAVRLLQEHLEEVAERIAADARQVTANPIT